MQGDSHAASKRSGSKGRSSAARPSFSDKGSQERYERLLVLLPERASGELAGNLSAAGDPDRALLQLEMLLQRHPGASQGAFEASSLALRAAVILFGSSQWLGQTLLRNPDLLRLFARPEGLATSNGVEALREKFARYRLRMHSEPLPVTLARFRRREYVRIFVRELLEMASLPEIAGEISALSDVLIEQALSHAEIELRRRHHGWPQLRSPQGWMYPARFAVFSLGKLGGNELNYSSDVDLLYLYDDTEDAGALPVPAREFFTELAQELTGVLAGASAEGQVFRVDLRLRPRGTSGEMVAGCAQALDYYRNEARDWELQALLKLRLSAGEPALGREFVDQVQELIYGSHLSLSAIRTAAQSLEKIQNGAGRQATDLVDVKNGRGGLREIEFAVQCLQRVHGGSEPWLRSSGTLVALQKLHDKGHIGDAEFRELGETYRLLRAIEHRLQCLKGAQSHRLPRRQAEQKSVFTTLGSWSGDVAELRRQMKSASALCARVLRLGAAEEKAELAAHSVGLGEPGLERLKRELTERSEVLQLVLAGPVGNEAQRGLRRFLAGAATGEERIRATLENAEWVARALPVFAHSAMATGVLAVHPEDIVALFRDSEELGERPISDQLRIQARRAMLRAAGRTLLEGASIWETMRSYTQSFERIITRALEASQPPEGFAVFALGRLGTCELDVGSDADLVFLHSGECSAERAGLCAQSIVEMLSGYTREGSAIEVDTRLRPHGSQGTLVVSLRNLEQYFESVAKPWEVLAFSKLRLIAGDEWLARETAFRISSLRRRFAASPQFPAELRSMRERIASSGPPENIKTGPGGLYDLDFCLGMLEAQGELETAGHSLPERLTALRRHELLGAPEAGARHRAAELYRQWEHAIRIVE